MSPHRTARTFQRGGVLGKSGGGHQRGAGFCRPRQPEDQVCRAVAAENRFCRNPLVRGQLCPQCPAQGVGVAVGVRQGSSNGVRHALRQAQRAHVGRKIQRVVPVLCPISGPVAAVCQLCHKITPRIASPSSRASRLSAYIILLARRMSSGSMGRRASPMVGLG